MYNILWMEYLPAFGHLVTNHQNQDSPPLERMEEFFYHGFYGLDGLFPMRDCEQDKNPINPLERMEGDALVPKLPPWSYKSKLLTPKPKT